MFYDMLKFFLNLNHLIHLISHVLMRVYIIEYRVKTIRINA